MQWHGREKCGTMRTQLGIDVEKCIIFFDFFPEKNRNATLFIVHILTILDAWALTQAAPWNSSRSNFSFHRQYGKANPFWNINLTLGCLLHFTNFSPRWRFWVYSFVVWCCLPFSDMKSMFSIPSTLGQVNLQRIHHQPIHHYLSGGKFMPIKRFLPGSSKWPFWCP